MASAREEIEALRNLLAASETLCRLAVIKIQDERMGSLTRAAWAFAFELLRDEAAKMTNRLRELGGDAGIVVVDRLPPDPRKVL